MRLQFRKGVSGVLSPIVFSPPRPEDRRLCTDPCPSRPMLPPASPLLARCYTLVQHFAERLPLQIARDIIEEYAEQFPRVGLSSASPGSLLIPRLSCEAMRLSLSN